MTYYNLQIGKLGSLVCREWDIDSHNFKNLEIIPENYLFHMDDTVCIKEGVTLKDIAILLQNDLELFSVITSCPYLDFLVNCIVSSPVTKSDLYAVEIKWKVISDRQEEGGPFLFEIVECYGVGSKGAKQLSFYLLNEIAHLPIILNEEYLIQDMETEKPIFSNRKKYRLGDLLKNIVFELGLPIQDEDDVKMENMVNNTINNLQKEYDIIIEENPKPCKYCGSDTRSFLFDKPNDICDKCFIKNKDN